MAVIISPIKFDPPRLRRRRKMSREAKKRRDDRRRSPGGDMHYQTFWFGLQTDTFWLFDGGAYYGPANDGWRP